MSLVQQSRDEMCIYDFAAWAVTRWVWIWYVSHSSTHTQTHTHTHLPFIRYVFNTLSKQNLIRHLKYLNTYTKVSKGCLKAIEVLENQFPDMVLVAISGTSRYILFCLCSALLILLKQFQQLNIDLLNLHNRKTYRKYVYRQEACGY